MAKTGMEQNLVISVLGEYWKQQIAINNAQENTASSKAW
jgi:hypothetical protein